MAVLKLADHLSLPIDVVTQTVAILAKRRAGKSYTMRRLAEQLFKVHQQIVIVDPKGDQWGIRSSANGKEPGLPVTILGGEHGDVPLEPTSGELVAKLVVEERVSLVLDLSLFRKNEVARFMTDFLENLYRMKARECYRTPMMLVIDEADAIAPQKPQHGEERMLGAAEDIVRRAGQRGIGCVLVTQRSAVLNKNVLTQAQVMVALRTIAPQDLAAMKAWIDVHGTPEQCQTLMASLPSLPIGDAWFWAPGWPTIDGIFKRVHVLPIETFDSGATPKPGVKAIEPKYVATVDLDALKTKMAATIEKAQADDPKQLRAKIQKLEAELKKLQMEPMVLAEPVIKEVPVWTAEQGQVVQRMIEELKAVGEVIHQNVRIVEVSLQAVESKLAKSANNISRKVPTVPQRLVSVPQNKLSIPRSETHRNSGSLGAGERKILAAVAQYPNGVTREQLTVMTGYKRSSRDTYLQRLSQAGLVIIQTNGILATQYGIEALGPDYEPLPTGDELQRYWKERLTGGERILLEVLVREYPKAVDREVLTERTGYKRSSRDTYLQRLSARQLITSERGAVRASDLLFD